MINFLIIFGVLLLFLLSVFGILLILTIRDEPKHSDFELASRKQTQIYRAHKEQLSIALQQAQKREDSLILERDHLQELLDRAYDPHAP